MTDTKTSKSPLTRNAKAARGCGCVSGLLVMGLGILVIGGWDEASWASALIGVLVGILVFALSGVNGIWERD